MEWIIVIILGAFVFAIVLSWIKTIKDALNNHAELKKKNQIVVSDIYNEKKDLKNKVTDLEEKLKSEKTINRLTKKYLIKEHVYTPFEKFRIVRLKRNLEKEYQEIREMNLLLEYELEDSVLEGIEERQNEIAELKANDEKIYIKYLETKK